jgi:hypothetical protein
VGQQGTRDSQVSDEPTHVAFACVVIGRAQDGGRMDRRDYAGSRAEREHLSALFDDGL